jgi:hypothetical protein
MTTGITSLIPRFSAISGECWRTLARTPHDDRMPKNPLIFRLFFVAAGDFRKAGVASSNLAFGLYSALDGLAFDMAQLSPPPGGAPAELDSRKNSGAVEETGYPIFHPQ